MSYPQNVTDVVLNVGLNDFRKGATADEIQEKTLELQLKYNEKFPNARQHLTQIPPVVAGHEKVNQSLQKLASYTESNLISVKVFIDKTTKRLCANLTNGIHYNEWGVRIFTKEIKKSLYSKANTGSSHLKKL